MLKVERMNHLRNAIRFAVLAPWVLASPAVAQSMLDAVPMTPRQASCEPVVTAQNRGCEVDNHFRCTNNDFVYSRIETHDVYGLATISLQDPVTGAFAVGDPYEDAEARFAVQDPVGSSIAQALDLGRVNVDIVGFISIFGIEKPISSSGTMTVEKTPLIVSDTALIPLRSEDTLFLPAPMGSIEAVSYAYLHVESGIVFGGESTDALSGSEELTNSGLPAAIDWPGSAGFGSIIPAFDCGEFSFDAERATQQQMENS